MSRVKQRAAKAVAEATAQSAYVKQQLVELSVANEAKLRDLLQVKLHSSISSIYNSSISCILVQHATEPAGTLYKSKFTTIMSCLPCK